MLLSQSNQFYFWLLPAAELLTAVPMQISCCSSSPPDGGKWKNQHKLNKAQFYHIEYFISQTVEEYFCIIFIIFQLNSFDLKYDVFELYCGDQKRNVAPTTTFVFFFCSKLKLNAFVYNKYIMIIYIYFSSPFVFLILLQKEYWEGAV